MTITVRAQWLLDRHTRWAGLGPSETALGACSPRVERLITEMREAELFPDLWREDEVLIAFLGAVAEARRARRNAYAKEVAKTAGQDTVRLDPMRGRKAHGQWWRM